MLKDQSLISIEKSLETRPKYIKITFDESLIKWLIENS